MSNKISFTRKMLGLPIILEGEVYPHITDLPKRQTVGEALKQYQVGGHRLCRWVLPELFEWYRYAENSNWWMHAADGLPEPEKSGYKLRVMFVFDRGVVPRPYLSYGKWHTEMVRDREFVKGGFLYDTPEQFEQWQRSA